MGKYTKRGFMRDKKQQLIGTVIVFEKTKYRRMII